MTSLTTYCTLTMYTLGIKFMADNALEDMKRQATEMLGLNPELIGKTQARQKFLPLVDALSQRASAIEITDHDKPVAVLLSYNHWLALASKLRMLSNKEFSVGPPNLVGSVQIMVDLEAASSKLPAKFKKSIRESAKKL